MNIKLKLKYWLYIYVCVNTCRQVLRVELTLGRLRLLGVGLGRHDRYGRVPSTVSVLVHLLLGQSLWTRNNSVVS